MVGGTSLGANVALELAVRDPERARGLFIEMPVLDNALPAVAGDLRPAAARPALRAAGVRAGLPRSPRPVPRTNYLLDIGLDWVRQRPGPSRRGAGGAAARGDGAASRGAARGSSSRTLIVGHPRDPLHPFSDSGMLAEELPNARLVEANSILEWRLAPARLTAELAAFLQEVWAAPSPSPVSSA